MFNYVVFALSLGALLARTRRVQAPSELPNAASSMKIMESEIDMESYIPEMVSLAELHESQNMLPHSSHHSNVKLVRQNEYTSSFGKLFMFPVNLIKSVFGCVSNMLGFGGRDESVEMPSYIVEAEHGSNGTLPSYEVRRYEKFQVVRTSGRKSNDREDFMMLAGYIGAVGPAQNTEEQKISMTAPVIADGKNGRLSFTLPSSVKTPPNPLNKRVQVAQRPETLWAVHRYSGDHDVAEAKKLASALRKRLIDEGYKLDSSVSWEWWRYNDPRVAPELKRNEVAIKIEG